MKCPIASRARLSVDVVQNSSSLTSEPCSRGLPTWPYGIADKVGGLRRSSLTELASSRTRAFRVPTDEWLGWRVIWSQMNVRSASGAQPV